MSRNKPAGAWDHIDDFEILSALVTSGDQPVIRDVAEGLLRKLHASTDIADLREVQADLYGYLLDAERRYSEALRSFKRGERSELDVIFWRRVVAQLRAIGDGVAWTFMAYDRKALLLLRRGDPPGHMYGKEGTAVEWALFNEHWDAGEPTVLSGLTNVIRYGDLLVSLKDGTGKLVEAKKDLKHTSGKQNRRERAVVDLLNGEPRFDAEDGPTWILQCDVPLNTRWFGAAGAIERALADGVATWSPEPGVAVMFMAPRSIKAESLEDGLAQIEAARQSVREAYGVPASHALITPGTRYPYRAGGVAPTAIWPLSAAHAARILTGEVLFNIEINADRIVDALRNHGVEAELVLPSNNDELPAKTEVLRFSRGGFDAALHGGGIEPLAVELQEIDTWAQGVAEMPMPDDGKFGSYLCFKETETWGGTG